MLPLPQTTFSIAHGQSPFQILCHRCLNLDSLFSFQWQPRQGSGTSNVIIMNGTECGLIRVSSHAPFPSLVPYMVGREGAIRTFSRENRRSVETIPVRLQAPQIESFLVFLVWTWSYGATEHGKWNFKQRFFVFRKISGPHYALVFFTRRTELEGYLFLDG